MNKLSISYKKNADSYSIIIGKKHLVTSKGKVITFKNLSFVKKVVEDLKAITCHEVLNDNNLIKFLIFSEEIKKKSLLKTIADHMETDTVLYRDYEGTRLEILQKIHWDPIVVYVEQRYKMIFKIQHGIIPISQNENNLNILYEYLYNINNQMLTVFYFLTKITNSVIIAISLLDNIISTDKAWELSNIEHQYNILKWGEIEDEKQKLLLKKSFYTDIIKFRNLINMICEEK